LVGRFSAGEIDCPFDDSLQYHLEIERRANGTADLAESGEVTVARLQFFH